MRANRMMLALTVSVAALLAGRASVLAEDASGSPALVEVRQEGGERSTRLIVDGTGPLNYTYYSPDPLTLVVDIPEADSSRIPSRINVGTREVETVRVTSLARADGRSLTRLEVRLASLVPYQIFSKGKQLQLVFERPQELAAAPTPAKTEAAPSTPSPVTEAEPSTPTTAPTATVTAEGASSASPAGPASRIVDVTSSTEGGQVSVTVKANGKLRYQDFLLGNPDRLVLDFAGVTTRAAKPIPVNGGPVARVRVGQYSSASPKVARLVVDLKERTAYRIHENGDALRIVFGSDAGPAPAVEPLAALRAQPDPEPATATAVAGPLSAAPAMPSLAATAPSALDPLQAPAPSDAAEKLTGGKRGCAEPPFTEQPISLNFRDGDLLDIFRLFADVSGLNVVVNPGVTGKVTLKLNEVPWDQALALILKTNNLGCSLDNNVLRIATTAALQKEEEDKRKLQEAQALAGELTDYMRRISYAKADDVAGVVKKAGAMSPRGSINIDTRTNAFLMTDLPSYVDKASRLIDELDRATPQVEIEARIVVTTRNFSRDLGIQWGFNQERSPRYGNTTGLTFPNSIVLNGGAAPIGNGIDPRQGTATQATSAGIGPGPRGYAVSLPVAGYNTALGLSMGNILGNFSLDAAIMALEKQGRARLLSTPKVTTQNNQAAEIKQGKQIPIQTTANNTISVSFKDAVLTLKVTPQITDAGTVILDVEVENNSADFGNLVNGTPPINTQSAKTKLLVRDGSTAVLGGIFQSTESTNTDRTPFFSDVPLLGYLFRNNSNRQENNELLIFLTPRISRS